jgi:hypothetical protein
MNPHLQERAFQALHEKLRSVRWERLEDAHGPADEIPGLLVLLASADAFEREEAMSELESRLAPPRWLPSVSAHTVAPLVHLLATAGVAGRDRILGLLATVIRRAEEKDGSAHDGATRAAVRAGLPVYLRLLRDPDLTTRLSVATLLAELREDASLIAQAIVSDLDKERDPGAFFTLLQVPALLGCAEPRWRQLCGALLSHPDPLRRLAAAAALARGRAPPERALEILLQALRAPDGYRDMWERSPWSRRGVVGDLAALLGGFDGRRRVGAILVLLDVLESSRGAESALIAESVLSLAFGSAPSPGELQPLQREVLLRVARCPAAWADPDALRRALGARRLPDLPERILRSLGEQVHGALGSDVEMEEDGLRRTLPIYRWAEIWEERKLGADDLCRRLAQSLDPVTVLATVVEMALGHYDVGRSLAGAVGAPPSFEPALDAALRRSKPETAQWAETFLEDRLRWVQAGGAPTLADGLALIALLRATGGAPFSSRWDLLIPLEEGPVTEELIAGLPPRRAEERVVGALAEEEAAIRDAEGWLTGLGQFAESQAHILRVCPSPKIARALLRLAARSGMWKGARSAIAEHGSAESAVEAAIVEFDRLMQGVSTFAEVLERLERLPIDRRD